MIKAKLKVWKNKKRNFNHQLNSYNALTTRNVDIKGIEEVYKLNFMTQNLSNKIKLQRSEAINNKNLQLHKSIERIKKFVPNLAELINITHKKKLEKKLIKRFENQETEKIMKEDLKKIIDKRNKIKKSISENLITFQKLDKQISDIKLSLYAHSKTEDKPILLTPNKNININKKNFEKRALSEKNIKKEKIQREKEIKLDFQRRFKILNNRLMQQKKEILQMEKTLPEIELNKNEILSNLKDLEKEKKDLKFIINNLSDKLYFHYLKILKEGIDTRNQGLSYIVKEILSLDKGILLSYFPEYLDNESIKYILEQAKLKIKLDEEQEQMKKLKNYFSDTLKIKKNKKRKSNILKGRNTRLVEIQNNEIKGITQEGTTNSLIERQTKFDINNNSFWNTNYFSPEKTSFTNFKNQKNLIDEEMNNNKIKKIEINKIKNNKEKENNKFNNSTSGLLDYSKQKENIINNKNNEKDNFYNKLLINHRKLTNSPFQDKKIDLSNLHLIPEKLSLTQVEKYIKTNQRRISKININKIVEYFLLNKKIKKIKNNLDEKQKNEMQRIFKKYLKKEYSGKLITEKEKVLSALIGEDNVQPELRKQIRKTKLFFESIKNCGLTNNTPINEYKVNQISHSFIKKQGI